MKCAERKLQVIEGGESPSFMLKIAFATLSRECVDQHFGTCRSLVIYGLTGEKASLLEVIQFKAFDQDSEQGKLDDRFAAITDCCAVYSAACGPSVINQLTAMGIEPLKVVDGTAIHGLIADLQVQIQTGASGWLGSAIRTAQSEESEGRSHIYPK